MMTLPTLLANILPVAALGGILGLDMVGFPQVMIARPIVSATLGAALLGNPAAGILMGVVLELIALDTLPFGAARYAEWGSAGVVGGAVFAAQPQGAAGALPVAAFAALAAAVFSSWSMVVLRQRAGQYARIMREQTTQGSASAVRSVQLRGLVMDVSRGAAVTAGALLVFIPLSGKMIETWGTDVTHSRALVLAVAATVAAGAVWKIFHTTARAGWLFLVGLGIGAALVAIR